MGCRGSNGGGGDAVVSRAMGEWLVEVLGSTLSVTCREDDTNVVIPILVRQINDNDKIQQYINTKISTRNMNTLPKPIKFATNTANRMIPGDV